jgi:hypothetical protein
VRSTTFLFITQRTLVEKFGEKRHRTGAHRNVERQRHAARALAALGIHAARLPRPRAPSPGRSVPLDALKSPLAPRVGSRAAPDRPDELPVGPPVPRGIPFLCTVPRPTYSVPSSLRKRV